MIPGYHAGELWLHEPACAITQLSEIGYRSVAIRSRQGVCVPGEPGFDRQWQVIRETATQTGVRLVVDAEASFVVDSHSASLPSLASDDESSAKSAINWIEQWIDAASDRPASGQHEKPASDQNKNIVLTIASGHVAPEFESGIDESMLERVARRLDTLARKAEEAGVVLAVRPAVGHAIASVAQFERLRQWLDHDVSLGLAADIGEMIHAGEMPLVARLQRQSDHLKLVYLCDTGSTYPGLQPAEHAIKQPAEQPTEQSAEQPAEQSAARSIGQPQTIGRMDVPLGTGELAVDRIVGELAKFTNKMPIIVRVAGHAGAGLTPARSAMECLNHVPAWRNASGG